MIKPDSHRLRRKVVAKALRSEAFVVGQALGNRTQRLPGWPYCFPNGALSPTGRKLDAFLRAFGYSIDPSTRLRYAYSSHVVQHYPGRAGKGDRRPSKAERTNCAVWLEREIALIRPKVVILLGKIAARDFLTRFGRSRTQTLGYAWGRLHDCVVGGHPVKAMAIPHFSYRFMSGRVNQIRRLAAKKLYHLLEER